MGDWAMDTAGWQYLGPIGATGTVKVDSRIMRRYGTVVFISLSIFAALLHEPYSSFPGVGLLNGNLDYLSFSKRLRSGQSIGDRDLFRIPTAM